MAMVRWRRAVLWFGVLSLVACGKPADDSAEPQAARLAEQQAAQRAARAIDECQRTIGERTQKFRTALRGGQLWDAVHALGNCPTILGDKGLEAELHGVRIRAFTADVKNPRATAQARLNSLEAFERDYPADAANFKALRAALEPQAQAQRRLDEAQRIKAERDKKRREGVRIGMTQQDVLDSSWGKPTRINRTIRASGVSEQWVYGGGFLYFEDGILTTIQN